MLQVLPWYAVEVMKELVLRLVRQLVEGEEERSKKFVPPCLSSLEVVAQLASLKRFVPELVLQEGVEPLSSRFVDLWMSVVPLPPLEGLNLLH